VTGRVPDWLNGRHIGLTRAIEGLEKQTDVWVSQKAAVAVCLKYQNIWPIVAKEANMRAEKGFDA